MKLRLAILAAVLASAFAFIDTSAQNKQPKKDVIPHGQASMPGPALSPQEALKKMQVPPGFHVELVAAFHDHEHGECGERDESDNNFPHDLFSVDDGFDLKKGPAHAQGP